MRVFLRLFPFISVRCIYHYFNTGSGKPVHSIDQHISQMVLCHSSFSLFMLISGTILTNQNSIQEEIKSRLKSGNYCYHLVWNLLSSSLLCKNIKIKIYRIIILPVILYRCETRSCTLKEGCRLRVSENMVLRIFGPKRDKVTGEWRRLHNKELYNLYPSPNIIHVIK